MNYSLKKLVYFTASGKQVRFALKYRALQECIPQETAMLESVSFQDSFFMSAPKAPGPPMK